MNMEIIISSIIGIHLGFYYKLELVTNNISSQINFASKHMHSTIITKISHSKTSSSDNNDTYEENNFREKSCGQCNDNS